MWQWVARGNIQQISYIPQTKHHSSFGLMLLCLGKVTVLAAIRVVHLHQAKQPQVITVAKFLTSAPSAPPACAMHIDTLEHGAARGIIRMHTHTTTTHQARQQQVITVL